MKLRISAVVLLTAFLLCGCASSRTKMVISYEQMGKALVQIHDRGVNLCEKEKVIPEEDCKKIKKIYNDTRRIYIVVGDSLAISLELDGTQWKKISDEQYAKLAAEFSNLLMQWLRLMTELGLVREK